MAVYGSIEWDRTSAFEGASGYRYQSLVNSELRLLHFYLFVWLKNSDYDPIVGVLRHVENSAPSLKIFAL